MALNDLFFADVPLNSYSLTLLQISVNMAIICITERPSDMPLTVHRVKEALQKVFFLKVCRITLGGRAYFVTKCTFPCTLVATASDAGPFNQLCKRQTWSKSSCSLHTFLQNTVQVLHTFRYLRSTWIRTWAILLAAFTSSPVNFFP